MYLYFRPYNLFAIFIDFYVDKNNRHMYCARKKSGEVILDISFIRIIWTSKNQLKREQENATEYTEKARSSWWSGTS
mgnify:CR=1 FL=1